MKKPLSVLLLFLVLLKIGGFVAILSVEREIVREAMFLKLSKSQIVSDLHCIIDNKNITWEEADREFWLDGKMYDIVKIEIKNGVKTYLCLADDSETDLAMVIQQLTQTDNSPLSETTKGIISWIFQQIIAPETSYPRFGNFCISSKIKMNFRYDYYAFDYFFKIIKPPKTS
jgi:hypothetical protein